MGGLQKLITVLVRFDTYKGGVRVGFININNMHNNDVGKGDNGFVKLMKSNKGWRSLERLCT